MKLIPLLYQTEMVQAIVQGNKTMTRRLKGLDEINEDPDGYSFEKLFIDGFGKLVAKLRGKERNNLGDSLVILVKCPYGNIGDILWVRETWQLVGPDQEMYAEDCGYVYKASENGEAWQENTIGWKWKPGIHMPFHACRIFLKITDIRLERIQDISQEDAKAEGIHREWDGTVYWYNNYGFSKEGGPAMFKKDAVTSFKSLWIKINKQQSWDKNPWVWCISFEVISTTGNPAPEIYKLPKRAKNIPQKQ